MKLLCLEHRTALEMKGLREEKALCIHLQQKAVVSLDDCSLEIIYKVTFDNEFQLIASPEKSLVFPYEPSLMKSCRFLPCFFMCVVMAATLFPFIVHSLWQSLRVFIMFQPCLLLNVFYLVFVVFP